MSRRAFALCASMLLLGSHGGIEQIGLFPVTQAPISAIGLSAGREFEGWIRLAISPDPRVMGRALPAGAVIAITFGPEFTPTSDPPRAFLLRGWPQGDLRTPYTVTRSADDPRSVKITLGGAIEPDAKDAPGLKAIHLAGGVRNPNQGTYSVHVTVTSGDQVESGDAAIEIAGRPTASIAPFNAAHGGDDADWQHVRPGAAAPVPFDFIINDVAGSHPEGLTLAYSRSPFSLEIRRAGRVLGHLTVGGGARIEPAVPATENTIRATVYAPASPGIGIVKASLEHGTGTTLRIYAEATPG